MVKDLTKTPILSTLLGLTFPMSWGIFSIIGFNLADTYFVGRLGKLELAAMSITFPVVMFFASLALGVSTATCSIISRSLGSKDQDKVKRYTSDSLTLSVLLVGIMAIIGFSTMEPLFRLLGANDLTLPLVKEYMTIWYSGMIFVAVPMTGNGAIRAQGDTKTASLIMIIAAITNVILDPIFIYGYFGVPSMGLKGAAVATVVARATTLVAALYVLHFKYKMLDFKKPKLLDAIDSWKRILFIAGPSVASSVINPLALSAATAIIARFGDSYVAAFGVVSRIESFAMIVIIAVSVSIAPMVGQNYGAGEYKRINTILKSGFALSLLWGALMAVLLWFFGDLLMPLFNNDLLVIEIGNMYFPIVPFAYGFYGIRMICCSALNALGKPFSSTFLVFVNFVILYLPLIIIGSKLYGILGVYYATAIANVIAGIASYIYMRKELKKQF